MTRNQLWRLRRQLLTALRDAGLLPHLDAIHFIAPRD